jgi:hypothetical protein
MRKSLSALPLVLAAVSFGAAAQTAPVIQSCTTLSWAYPVAEESRTASFEVYKGLFKKATVPATERSVNCSVLGLSFGSNDVKVRAVGTLSGQLSEWMPATVEVIPPPLPAPTTPVYQ